MSGRDIATAALMLTSGAVASAATPTVGLGTADPFAVLAGAAVTNTGVSNISGSVGVSAGSAVDGFPPGIVTDGVIRRADPVAAQAQADLTVAYNDAAGRTPPTAVPVEIGGRTLVSGVYKADTELGLTGTVTLDAQSDPNAVFIFQAGSTLTTASNSTVNLINGAQPCNVFWQVGSSAALGTSTTFVGSILALTSITLDTNATVAGRVLARNGNVTLDTNTITRPGCVTAPVTTTPPATTTPDTTTPGATTTPGPMTTPGATTTTPVTTTAPPVVITVPVIPGVPSIPDVPPVITLPPIPGVPGLPNTPGVPTGPNTPGVPTGPNTPGVPTGPNTPGVPTGPNTPGVPIGPGTQITEVPRGGVDTGDGSTTGSHSSAEWSLLLLSITAFGAGSALILRRTRGHRADVSTARTTPRPAASRTRAAAGIVAAVLLLVAVLTGCSTPSSTAPADSAVSAAPQQRTTTGPTGASPTVLGESTPVHLSVPSIGVETDLVGLGLQNDGTMEVPSGGFPAGWYSGSPTPGELGPSILAGHVDWDGAPGVFADLTEVAAGDAVIVTREDGTVASFAVTAVEQYPKDQFPTSSVYGDIDHAGLRLITCGGAFDTDAASYGDNIVVYADAI